MDASSGRATLDEQGAPHLYFPMAVAETAEEWQAAVKSARTITALRPLLAAPPDRSGHLASDAFREGARACYILARSGVLREHPATFQLAEPDQLPALPAPVSDTVKDMRLRLGA